MFTIDTENWPNYVTPFRVCLVGRVSPDFPYPTGFWVFVRSGEGYGLCPPHANKGSEPGRAAKEKSSFTLGLGRTHPEKNLRSPLRIPTHLRSPRPETPLAPRPPLPRTPTPGRPFSPPLLPIANLPGDPDLLFSGQAPRALSPTDAALHPADPCSPPGPARSHQDPNRVMEVARSLVGPG
jgi:hypothetical protein